MGSVFAQASARQSLDMGLGWGFSSLNIWRASMPARLSMPRNGKHRSTVSRTQYAQTRDTDKDAIWDWRGLLNVPS